MSSCSLQPTLILVVSTGLDEHNAEDSENHDDADNDAGDLRMIACVFPSSLSPCYLHRHHRHHHQNRHLHHHVVYVVAVVV